MQAEEATKVCPPFLVVVVFSIMSAKNKTTPRALYDFNLSLPGFLVGAVCCLVDGLKLMLSWVVTKILILLNADITGEKSKRINGCGPRSWICRLCLAENAADRIGEESLSRSLVSPQMMMARKMGSAVRWFCLGYDDEVVFSAVVVVVVVELLIEMVALTCSLISLKRLNQSLTSRDAV